MKVANEPLLTTENRTTAGGCNVNLLGAAGTDDAKGLNQLAPSFCGKLRLRIDDFSDAPDAGESVLNSGDWSIREIAAELGASQERGAVLPGEALPGAATRSPRRAQEGRLAHGVAC